MPENETLTLVRIRVATRRFARYEVYEPVYEGPIRPSVSYNRANDTLYYTIDGGVIAYRKFGDNFYIVNTCIVNYYDRHNVTSGLPNIERNSDGTLTYTTSNNSRVTIPIGNNQTICVKYKES